MFSNMYKIQHDSQFKNMYKNQHCSMFRKMYKNQYCSMYKIQHYSMSKKCKNQHCSLFRKMYKTQHCSMFTKSIKINIIKCSKHKFNMIHCLKICTKINIVQCLENVQKSTLFTV